MNTSDREYLKTPKSFAAHVFRLIKEGDKAEVRLLEFFEGAESKPHLWLSLGTTFDVVITRHLSYSAARYRNWQRGCKLIPQKRNRTTIGVEGVVVIHKTLPDSTDSVLQDMLLEARTHKAPLTRSRASSVIRRHKTPKNGAVKKVSWRAEAERLQKENNKLKRGSLKLKSENLTLDTCVSNLKVEVDHLCRKLSQQAVS